MSICLKKGQLRSTRDGGASRKQAQRISDLQFAHNLEVGITALDFVDLQATKYGTLSQRLVHSSCTGGRSTAFTSKVSLRSAPPCAARQKKPGAPPGRTCDACHPDARRMFHVHRRSNGGGIQHQCSDHKCRRRGNRRSQAQVSPRTFETRRGRAAGAPRPLK